MRHMLTSAVLKCWLAFLCMGGLATAAGFIAPMGLGCGGGSVAYLESGEGGAGGGGLISGVTLNGTIGVEGFSAGASKATTFAKAMSPAASAGECLARARFADGTLAGEADCTGGSFTIIFDPTILITVLDPTILVEVRLSNESDPSLFILINCADCAVDDEVAFSVDALSTVATLLLFYPDAPRDTTLADKIVREEVLDPSLLYRVLHSVTGDDEEGGGGVDALSGMLAIRGAIEQRVAAEHRGLAPDEMRGILGGDAGTAASLLAGIDVPLMAATVQKFRSVVILYLGGFQDVVRRGSDNVSAALSRFFRCDTLAELSIAEANRLSIAMILEDALVSDDAAAAALDLFERGGRGTFARGIALIFANDYTGDDCTAAPTALFLNVLFDGLAGAARFLADEGIGVSAAWKGKAGMFGGGLCNILMISAASLAQERMFLLDAPAQLSIFLTTEPSLYAITSRERLTELRRYLQGLFSESGDPQVPDLYALGSGYCPPGWGPGPGEVVCLRCTQEDRQVWCPCDAHDQCGTGHCRQAGEDRYCWPNDHDCIGDRLWQAKRGEACTACSECSSLRCVDGTCRVFFECGEAGQPECPCGGDLCPAPTPACSRGGSICEAPYERAMERYLGGEISYDERNAVIGACYNAFNDDGSARGDTGACLQQYLCPLDAAWTTCAADIEAACGIGDACGGGAGGGGGCFDDAMCTADSLCACVRTFPGLTPEEAEALGVACDGCFGLGDTAACLQESLCNAETECLNYIATLCAP